MNEASQSRSGESLMALLPMLKPLSSIGMNIIRHSASFARRHPVQSLAAAVVLGYVGSRFLRERPLTDAKY